MPFQYVSDLPFRIYVGNIGTSEALQSILIQIVWIVITTLITNTYAQDSTITVWISGIDKNLGATIIPYQLITVDAENAVPNVGESNNQRLEEIHFEQLTRDSESRLNVLKREVHAITDIEIMNAAAKDTSTVLNRFQEFDKDTICKIEAQLKAAKIELENAINDKISFQEELNNEPFITTDSQPGWLDALAHLGKAWADRKIKKEIDSSIHYSEKEINYYTQFIERFEQITAEFRIVLRGLNDIQQMLSGEYDDADAFLSIPKI